MQQQTMVVFPNPYASLDHKGRLAGACPQADQARAQHVAPSRKLVGATIVTVEGSYNNAAEEGRGVANLRGSRADNYFQFDCLAPIELQVDQSLAGYYAKRDAEASAFLCADKAVPYERLAMARIKACSEYVASYGKEPPVEEWAKQFPLDELVAEAASELAKLLKAEADAKPKPVDAVKAAQEAREKALAEASKQAAAVAKSIAERGTKLAKPNAAKSGEGQ